MLVTLCHIKENPSYFHVIHFLDIRWQSPHFIFHTRGPYPFQKSNATFFSTAEQPVWPVASEAVGKAHQEYRDSPITAALALLQHFFSFSFPLTTKRRRVILKLRNTWKRGKIYLFVPGTPYAMTWKFPCQEPIGRNRQLPKFPPHFSIGRGVRRIKRVSVAFNNIISVLAN